MIGFLWPRTAIEGSELRVDGQCVFLRPPALDDYDAWAALRASSRDFLVPWEPAWSEDALSRAAYRRRLKRYALDRRTGTGCTFFIFRAEDEALLGGLGFGNIRRAAAQSASVGYWIGVPHARQGYMTDALGCAITFAFKQLRLHRIEAACLPENAPSCALLLRADFRLEGEARKYLCINGKWQDHQIYALLHEDRPAND